MGHMARHSLRVTLTKLLGGMGCDQTFHTGRRTIIRGALISAAATPLLSIACLAQDTKIPLRLVISSDAQYRIPDQAKFEGKYSTEQSKGLPVIVTVAVGLVLVSYLTDLILDVYSRLTQGTLVVDVRNGQVALHNTPGSPLELIIVTDNEIRRFERTEISKVVVKAFLDKIFGSKA